LSRQPPFPPTPHRYVLCLLGSPKKALAIKFAQVL
jgi:hypothetical protein